MAKENTGESLGFESCEAAIEFARPVGERIEIKKNVQFVTGKAEIRPESHALLDAVVCLMNNPQGDYLMTGMGNLRVEGHTDNVGSDSLNMKLSQERAKSVAEYLISAGLDSERVSSAGYGEEQPIADNSTGEGRALNRRVEFKLMRI